MRELEAVDDERERRGLPPVAPVVPAAVDRGDGQDSGTRHAEEGSAAPGRRAAAAHANSGSSGDPLSVPLRGRIAAGRPLDAIEDSEDLDIAAVLRLDRASYALRVRGDSMVEDGIHDGDYVLVDESRKDPEDGETVVAILEGSEATLKRFYRDGNRFKLMPANSQLHPISVERDKLEIRGVVVGQLRRY